MHPRKTAQAGKRPGTPPIKSTPEPTAAPPSSPIPLVSLEPTELPLEKTHRKTDSELRAGNAFSSLADVLNAELSTAQRIELTLAATVAKQAVKAPSQEKSLQQTPTFVEESPTTSSSTKTGSSLRNLRSSPIRVNKGKVTPLNPKLAPEAKEDAPANQTQSSPRPGI